MEFLIKIAKSERPLHFYASLSLNIPEHFLRLNQHRLPRTTMQYHIPILNKNLTEIR